jgi:hypothetical protein
MSNNDDTADINSRKTRANAKPVGLLSLGILTVLAVWIAAAYLHVLKLQEYIADFIPPNGSILRIPLIAAFGGMVLSIPILRRLSCRDKTSQVKPQPIPQHLSSGVHPLFMTSRPARDTNFVIRKTKNRGRISRNRAGERLPPSIQE